MIRAQRGRDDGRALLPKIPKFFLPFSDFLFAQGLREVLPIPLPADHLRPLGGASVQPLTMNSFDVLTA